MKRFSMALSVLAILGVMLVASPAEAQWGYYRVTSSYSLPSVPYAFQPVVVPVVQPTTTFSPVVVNQPVTVAPPLVASQPVIMGRPIVVAQPTVTAPVVVRRGLFRRPVIVAPAAGVVVPAAAPITTISPAPVVVQRPVFWVP